MYIQFILSADISKKGASLLNIISNSLYYLFLLDFIIQKDEHNAHCRKTVGTLWYHIA